ncbi:hypothetical protein C4K39_0893 [Pseudomonas sessilinigenes]|nr:hypothetical protein C4K39_0893 [Pseudomonas sessilinigenes]
MCKIFQHQSWQATGPSFDSPRPRATRIPRHRHLAGQPRQLGQKQLGIRLDNAPIRGVTAPGCTLKRQQMHHKEPAQTVKCVKFYTNASFLYVRTTL